MLEDYYHDIEKELAEYKQIAQGLSDLLAEIVIKHHGGKLTINKTATTLPPRVTVYHHSYDDGYTIEASWR